MSLGSKIDPQQAHMLVEKRHDMLSSSCSIMYHQYNSHLQALTNSQTEGGSELLKRFLTPRRLGFLRGLAGESGSLFEHFLAGPELE